MNTAQFLWRLTGYRRWIYVANILLWIGMELWPLLPGEVTRRIFDHLSGSQAADLSLLTLVALLVVLALARWAYSAAAFSGAAYGYKMMEGLLRRNLLARILELPGAEALPDSPGKVLNSLRDDVDQACDATDWILDTVGYLCFMAAALVILLRINTGITLLVFLPILAVLLLVRAAGNRLEANRRASREATAQATGLINEVFGAVQAIQVAGAEERVVDHFRSLNDRRRTLMLRDRLLTQLLDAISGNTVSLGTGVILLFSARALARGAFTIGDFALFVYYLQFFSLRALSIGQFMAHYRQTGVALERMRRLLRGAPEECLTASHPLYLTGEIPKPAQPTRTESDRLEELTATDLTFRYPGSGRGVEQVDLRIPRGSFTVIAGRVGSGKTTLLRALTGLLPLQSGEVRWNGYPVKEPDRFFVPPRCATTPQIPILFSDTLKANILLGLAEDRADLPGAIHTAALEQDLAGMEQGLETLVGSRGVRLSGGQVQRTAAARMFVREPELLIFDDLSSALDVITEQQLWGRVFGEPGNTCVAVSHRRAALRRADQIIVLQEGRVVDRGRLEDLLERCEEMRHLWNADTD